MAFYFSDTALSAAVESGEVSQAVLDDKTLRVLTSMFAAGLFDRAPSGNILANVTSPEHNSLARTLAANAMVLLQNKGGVLPLSAAALRHVAVIGDACHTAPIVAGGGSGAVAPPYIITVLDGVTAQAPGVNITYTGTADVAAAVAAAAAADVAIVCTATTSEGFDRANLSLPYPETALIAAVAAAQPRTVAVVTSTGAVLLPFADAVPAVLATFLPGQEAGNAVADVLFGAVNPNGKLPLTFPVTETDINFTAAQYPGLPTLFPLEANYSEGLLVGYRYYDAHALTPAFPFGHGLSYTSFLYSNLSAHANGVSACVTNTGPVAGTEVPQLYLAFPPAAGEPPLQLKGFQKVTLQPGASECVTFPLRPRDVCVYSEAAHAWVSQPGTFGALVGASSRDIRLKGTFIV